MATPPQLPQATPGSRGRRIDRMCCATPVTSKQICDVDVLMGVAGALPVLERRREVAQLESPENVGGDAIKRIDDERAISRQAGRQQVVVFGMIDTGLQVDGESRDGHERQLRPPAVPGDGNRLEYAGRERDDGV